MEQRPELEPLAYLSDLTRLEWCWYSLELDPRLGPFSIVSSYPIHIIWEVAVEGLDKEIVLGDRVVEVSVFVRTGQRVMQVVRKEVG